MVGTLGYDPSSEYRHTSGGAPGEPKRQYGNEGCGNAEDNLHDSVELHDICLCVSGCCWLLSLLSKKNSRTWT
jgi:hypothetical protein